MRTEFGRFSRQVSGYSLEHLLPENGRRLDRFLVGSEGTLGLVTEATVRLVQEESQRLLLVLGYPSMVDAADAVPTLLSVGGGRLVACEGLDARIVDLVRARGSAVPELPRGAGWLFVEVTGDDAPSVAGRLAAAAGALGSRVVTDPRSRPRCGGSARTAPGWRPQPAHAGVLRLGGRGRAARAPRGLAARLRRAAA